MNITTLNTYLLQQSAGGSITLADTDTQLGATWQAFLSTSPVTSMTLTVGAGGIQLAGDTLTVTGTLVENWPIQGIPKASTSMTQVVFVISGTDASAVAITGTGTVKVGSVSFGVQITASSTTNPGEWTLQNPQTVSGLSPIDLLGYPQFGKLPIQIPSTAAFFGDAFPMESGQFSILYYPQTENDADYSFLLDAPQVQWVIVTDVFALQGIQFGGQWFGTGLSFVLVSQFMIGTVAVDLVISASSLSEWEVSIVPHDGDAFPSLSDIVGLIGGQSMQQQVDGGMNSMSLDSQGFDAAINQIVFVFDISKLSLTSLQVFSTLSLKGIDYHVDFQYPNLTINGWLDPSTPVGIADFLGSYGLPTTGIPNSLEITQLSLLIDFSLNSYALSVVISDETGWDLGPLALDSIAFNVGYEGGNFYGSINAVVTIGEVDIELTAGYDNLKGWYFQGGTTQDSEIKIGDVIDQIGKGFGITVPTSIANMTLDNLNFSYETGTGNFNFGLEMHLQIQEVPVDLIPSISIENTGTATSPNYSSTYAGQIIIGNLEFLLLFNTEDNTDLFMATYSHKGDQEAIMLYDLVQSISPGLAKIIPESLAIDLKDVLFAYYNITSGATTTKKWTIAMDLSATFNLSDIPLLGQVLPPDQTVGFENLKVQYSNNAFTKDEAGRINTLLATSPGDVQPLQAEGFPSGVNAVAKMKFGTESSTLGLDMTGNASQGPQPMPQTQAPAKQKFSNAKWFTLQRAIGPIYFGRVGVDFTNGTLFFLLDASFEVAGLTLSLNAAGFGTPLTKFDLQFTLSGIGIQYTAPGIDVGGGLLIVDPPSSEDISFQFDGDIIIKVGKLGIAAIGSYAQYTSGDPSLFVYANVNLPIGPIPAFFITGLGAGFGYNRDVIIPTMDEVLDFPLIALANQDPKMPTGMSDVLAIMEGQKAGPSGKVKQWIAPRLGEYWMAFGLQFNTYMVFHSNAMIVAKFGAELELALIGISKLQLPQHSKTLYVNAELMLVVDWKPADGFFGLSAQLSKNSFVLDPNCHITGGFAFFIWYSGQNAGQFVVTLGGYHPQFKVPSYYPSVPRLGVSWVISSMLNVTGSAYFALTPSAVMAGGNLSMNFHLGDLKAWFTAQADMLITFNPFYFNISVGVSVGVSYKLNLLFTTTTISVSLGAKLNFYGPEVGGSVYVDFYLFGFTISFGPSPDSINNTPQDWDTFKSLLPDGKENTVNLNTGLKSTLTDGTPVVRANKFSFTTNTVIPAQKLTYNGTNQVNPDGFDVTIRPMNEKQVVSQHDLRITRQGSTNPVDLSTWDVGAVYRDMPAAMWGVPLTDKKGNFLLNPTTPTADVVPSAPVGLNVAAPLPTLGGSPGPVVAAKLSVEPVTPDGLLPILINVEPVTTLQPALSTDTVHNIAQLMGSVKTQRDAIFSAMQSAGIYNGWNGALTQYAATAGNQFTDQPFQI
jgi:hypothetical protein